ncbi:MAG TPA: radical SAM protein [Thermoplasmatales archaeon]|nr:radical SAM protein [Thermoplasmatales archaeon]
MISFGPVPSRRLGRSLGINNIPPKICTYSCGYCQVGRTVKMNVERKEFYKTEELFKDVRGRVEETRKKNKDIDYLTFVPDGEPTLDINLGKEIDCLKSLNIKIAVITNASLLLRDDVKKDLKNADLVSVKIDTVNEKTWKKINRPHPSLKLSKILEGISKFGQEFNGILYTETMLVKGLNDNMKEIEEIADFIEKLSAEKSYISIPIRPPAEKWVKSPSEVSINKAYQIFKEKNIDVELLIGYEGNEFTSTGDIRQDILSITSVHPIREEGMEELLRGANSDWEIIENLKNEKKIVEVKYKGKRFYMKNLSKIR